MRFLWGAIIFDWKLWGIVDKKARWFVGYSKNIIACGEKRNG